MKQPDEHFFISLKTIYKSRLSLVIFWFFLALILGYYLATQFGARQLATVSLDVGISVIRFTLPLLIILLVQELISREFERKTYLNSFTYPRSRTTWLIGRMSAILMITCLALAVMAVILAILSSLAAEVYQQATPISLRIPYFVTLAMIFLDLLVVTAIATFISISTRTPSFVLLGTLGFTLIARSYTPIIELIRDNPYAVEGFADPGLYQDSLGLLAFILPDLGRLDVRMITLYNDMIFLPNEWPLLVFGTVAYVVTLVGLSIWILNKREFN